MALQLPLPSLLPLSLSILALAAATMWFFTRKNHFELEGRTILITGSSQGMGREVAALCARKGAHVIIVARNEAKLASALEYIRGAAKSPSQRFTSLSADLTSSSENIRVLAEATEWNNNALPDIVWANAGSALPRLFLDTNVETLRAQMDVNYWAAAYLAHATLKAWLTPLSVSAPPLPPAAAAAAAETGPLKPRHFVITSSVIAFAGLAGYAPYGPAKSALRSLGDNLSHEMNLYNGALAAPGAPRLPETKIHVVFPGTITSPGLELENQVKHPVTQMLEEGDVVQSEAEVAAAAVRGLERGEALVTTQILGHVMRWGMLGNRRNGWGVVDAFVGGVVNWVWCFVGPDMERKVWKWGKEKGISDGRAK
ncbi:NAD(P)-binding protein [Trichodelitschia bisporula]|uniref:3-dehydrosphinganine reductase n=1 Tax=Trichodelitschia bisporula TaxID=703511 RepID=A0A6G1HYP5_9PEZI|nr:NAD(P)-binding protein [Trichodelitschia bisporula]